MESTETPNHKLILGVPSENHPQERMVSLVPHNIISLKEIGVEVLIEHNAGINAGFTDKQYAEVGGTIVPQRSDIFDSANMIAQVRGPSKTPDSGQKDIAQLGNKHIIIGFLQPQFAIKEIMPVYKDIDAFNKDNSSLALLIVINDSELKLSIKVPSSLQLYGFI